MDRVVPEIEFWSIRNQPKNEFHVSWIRHFLHFFFANLKQTFNNFLQLLRAAICSQKTRNSDFGYYPIRGLILLASYDTSKRIMGDVFTVQGFVWPPLSFSFFGRRKKRHRNFCLNFFSLSTHFSNLGQAYLAVLKNQLWRFFSEQNGKWHDGVCE